MVFTTKAWFFNYIQKYIPICQWAYSTKEKKANSSQIERGLQTKKEELIKGILE